MTPTPASVRARRVGISLLLCALVQGMAPTPALAWFGWLDKWSGPGKFWGTLYEVRLVCFGEQSGVRQIEAAYGGAQRSTRLALSSGSELSPAESFAIRAEWTEVLLLMQAAQERWHAREDQRASVRILLGDPILNTARVGAARVQDQPAEVLIPREALITFAQHADATIVNALSHLAGQAIAAGGTGMFWSLCSDEKERRFSIELNVDDWRAFDNETNSRFSGGTSIRLITVMPSVTWSVIGRRNADVVDVGMAGGYYAFSSQGFDALRGFILEPLRVELHAPTSWAGEPLKNPRRLASMFTYRFGLMTIPAGFESDAFAPGSHEGRMRAELVQTHGIFFNLNSLLSNPKKIDLPKTFPTP